MIGQELSSTTHEVTKDDIRKLAVATGDLNPLYLDEGRARRSRYGGIIAPPLLYFVAVPDIVPESQLSDDGMFIGSDLPIKYSRVVAGGAEVEFFTPIRPGDVITAKTKIADISERKSTKEGWIAVFTREITFTNQKGEVMTVTRQTLLYS